MLATLSAAAAALDHDALLGVAGWLSLRASAAAAPRQPRDAARGRPSDAVAAAVGTVGVPLPAPSASRLAAADVLRGAWWVDARWVALLMREPLPVT